MQTTIKLDIIVVVRKGFIIKAQKCDEYCGCNSHQERQTNVKRGTYHAFPPTFHFPQPPFIHRV